MRSKVVLFVSQDMLLARPIVRHEKTRSDIFKADATAIVKVYTDGHGFCLDEVCYATGLQNGGQVYQTTPAQSLEPDPAATKGKGKNSG